MQEHNWIRHTLDEVEIVELPWPFTLIPVLRGPIALRRLGGVRERAVGCDDCGLGWTPALAEEPCLGQLADQLEESEGEDLTS